MSQYRYLFLSAHIEPDIPMSLMQKLCQESTEMFFREDNTYNDIREKSLNQWLLEMEKHEDIAVRGGVKLCREYMQYLKDKNTKLEQENELKNSYLKKMSKRG